MKIVFLNYYQGHNQRGLETFVQEISKYLKEYGHETKVIFSTSPITQTRSRLNLLQRLYLDKASLSIGYWTLKTLLNLHGDQKLIIGLNGGWQTFLIRLYTLITFKKMVHIAQSGPGWDDRFNLIFHPDIFVCLTPAQLNWAKSVFHWPTQSFAVISNGVDLNRFSPRGNKFPLKLLPPIVLAVGALEPNKRLDLTIKAVAKLPKVSLVIAGAGPLETNLQKLGAKLLGPKRFTIVSLSHQDIPALYRSAQVFTLASEKSEAFGIVYLEALASGLNVVATDDISRRYILGPAGFLVDPLKTDEYAQSLSLAMGTNHKESIKQAQKFSWKKVASKYNQLLETLE